MHKSIITLRIKLHKLFTKLLNIELLKYTISAVTTVQHIHVVKLEKSV